MNEVETGGEIKEFAEGILDQTIEESLFYTILNALKDRREETRAWMMLRKLDTTKNATTSAQTLPVDCRNIRKIVVGGIEYTEIPFESQHLNQNSNVYYVDWANGTFTLCGTPSGSVYFYYIKTTDSITETTEPVWPKRFIKLLGFDVAGYIMNGQDADDLFARMSPENKGQAIAIENTMITWDSNLQINAQGGRRGMEGIGGEEDIGIL
jgi:hypothetical protein